jgi:hypothetical protein
LHKQEKTKMVSENNLSSSPQTTLAVAGALVLVAGVAIHRHRHEISSFFAENIAKDGMNHDTDWDNLTISAQVWILFIYIEVFFEFKNSCLRGKHSIYRRSDISFSPFHTNHILF